MTTWLTSWRLALRLARRDLLKHRARAIIALVMVTLPVLGVVAADVLIQTSSVSATEGLDRRLGTVASASVEIAQGDTAVRQAPDPWSAWGSSDHTLAHPATFADIAAVLGPRAATPAALGGEILARTAHGRERMRADQIAAGSRLATGLYRLVSGRWPSAPDEVVVNQAARDRGIGTTLRVGGAGGVETPHHIVGTIVDATTRSQPVVVAPYGAFPAGSLLGGQGGQTWLVDGPPITWQQVLALNKLGVLVTDRQIASHPEDYPDPLQYDGGSGDDTAQVAALVVVMALIEVVLLAGPAFAVGARKQQRSLALLVSSGGTPRQARRVIIAGGLLLGLTAAVVGVLGGLGAAWALQPVVQRFDEQWLGPFQASWWHLVGVAAFGLVSALIACVVPAWIASRQNVVAVLAGRRGDAKPVRAFPVIGVGLFLLGVLIAIAGARDGGDLTVAWSAVVCVLGMVLLVPVVVSWVARVAGRLPLPVRFAARDAVRHRTRTVPAVAAVAATVAGVVALGISTSSDEKENRETYHPMLVMGNAYVSPSYDLVPGPGAPAPVDWAAVQATVRQQLPEVGITPVVGVGLPVTEGRSDEVVFRDPAAAEDDGDISPVNTWGSIGTDTVVSDGSDLSPTVADAFAPAEHAAQALAAGKVVLLTGDRGQTRLDHVVMRVSQTGDDGRDGHDLTVPALVLYRPADEVAPLRAVIPPAIAAKAGIATATAGLELDQPQLSPTAEKDLDAALDGLATPASVNVERGYQAEASTVILQWVLALLAAILMLGGTLTAMFLALSDARPDLATMAAVGAAPRTRRSVASAYTLVVAFVGAGLGMIVGFVPGIAITWPLTTGTWPGNDGPYLDIPWLLIAGVVLGLPILTALIVAACVRSRLPMVSRLN